MTANKRTAWPSPVALAAACAHLFVAACGARESREEITESRKLDAPRPEQLVVADAKKRLGPPPMDPTASPHGDSPHGESAPTSPSRVEWTAPEGWREIPPKPPVTAAFAVTSRDKLDASLSVLPGTGGGLLANMNRWRGQMGLSELTADDVSRLPRVKTLGVDAPLLQMDGTFRGAAGYTMAAVVVERPGAAVFVKLVGPTADVTEELERFRAFCASLRDSAATSETPVPAPAPTGGPSASSPLRWSAPEGWTPTPSASKMRLVTLAVKDAPGVECVVTLLPGAAGGVEANMNLWRQQLGLEPLAADAIAALPSIPVLGQPAPVLEIDAAGQGMYGLICSLGEQTVFVKMKGPTEALRRERERFLAFCKSLARN